MQQKDPYLFHLSYDTGLYFDRCSHWGDLGKIRGFVGGRLWAGRFALNNQRFQKPGKYIFRFVVGDLVATQDLYLCET